MYLDSIKQLVHDIKMQRNTSSAEVKGDNTHTTPKASTVNKPRLLTKPAKVPTWTKDLTLETYSKQIQTWSDVLEEIPEHIKYADLIENLKTNKDIKGLQKYLREHILPI